MKGAKDSEVLREFVASIDRINALADAAPGFVCRLQAGDEDGGALAAPAPDAGRSPLSGPRVSGSGRRGAGARQSVR
jgi:hypothetical protein